MNLAKKKLLISVLLSFVFSLIIVSCNDSDNQLGTLNLSKTKASVNIGDKFSVDILLDKTDLFKTIKVQKTVNGKIAPNYTKELAVKDLSFPYTFKETIVAGDENGIVVYSFYGLDKSGNKIDASDIVLTVAIAQLPLLLKYDWRLSSQIIQSNEFAEPYMKDDVYRFNTDLSWELDWGDIKSAGALETLNSYCSWKIIGTESHVDSLYMIKYNIFAPTVPEITKYKVLKLEDRKMILESRQDLSFLPGYAADEKVVETYLPISKSDDFTPYRGANPLSYFVDSCNPGAY